MPVLGHASIGYHKEVIKIMIVSVYQESKPPIFTLGALPSPVPFSSFLPFISHWMYELEEELLSYESSSI